MRKLEFAENINGTGESGLIDVSSNPPEIFCLCTEEKAHEILGFQKGFNDKYSAKVAGLISALKDIRNWDDDLEYKWEDAGYRAKSALDNYYKNK